MAVASFPREIGGRPSPVPARGPPTRARCHSSSPLAAHARARPSSASRGQNPGPSWPSRAMPSRLHVPGKSTAARTTPSSGAATRRAVISLPQPELLDEAVERVHLAGDPPAELLRPHVAIGREVPLLGELLRSEEHTS